jgi:hypothetical protein
MPVAVLPHLILSLIYDDEERWQARLDLRVIISSLLILNSQMLGMAM